MHRLLGEAELAELGGEVHNQDFFVCLFNSKLTRHAVSVVGYLIKILIAHQQMVYRFSTEGNVPEELHLLSASLLFPNEKPIWSQLWNW